MKTDWRRSAIHFLLLLFSAGATAQALDDVAVVGRIDVAIQERLENVLRFTVTEHYRVFRNQDETQPVAEMLVKASYRKETGKEYGVLSQTGSALMRKFVLAPILENEKRINLPGNREAGLFTSANYEMKLQSNRTVRIDGHDCLVFSLTPRHKAPNKIAGTMWVNAADYTMVRVEGMASKNPSFLVGPTEMMRQYTMVAGYAQADHSRVVSHSPVFGRTVITIDYQDYQVHLRGGHGKSSRGCMDIKVEPGE